MTNYQDVPGVKYVVARPFQSEYGDHQPGEVFHQADQVNTLESLVRSGLLYPYAPDDGYDYLPPHLFNHVENRQEVLDKIEGDNTVTVRDPFRDEDGTKPEVMLQAEVEAAVQDRAYQVVHEMDEDKMEEAAEKLNKEREAAEKEHQEAEIKRLKDLKAGKKHPLLVPDGKGGASKAKAVDPHENESDLTKAAHESSVAADGQVAEDDGVETGSSTTKQTAPRTRK